MINKKLIVYGDSFADSNLNASLFPRAKHWFHHLVEHYTGQPYDQPFCMQDRDEYDYLNRGTTGTSTFFSLWKFLEDLDVYHAEKIIFLFSAPRRTPLARGPLTAKVFMHLDRDTVKNIRRMPGSRHEKEFQTKQIQLWYKYFIHEEPLIQFIQQSIFDRVQLECKKRNIDLVFIECLSAIYEDIRIDFKYLEYPLIRNLETVSRKECPLDTYEHLAGGDSRAGHMNGHNNKLCADEIIKCFEDKTPRLINFDEVLGLDYSEETFNFYWKRQADGSINPLYD